MDIQSFTLPLSAADIAQMRCGDVISVSGTVYTARDAAHKRFVELLAQGKPLPFPCRDAAVFYCGPTPAATGEIIGSCGPTTSSRMDDYTPALLRAGLRVMIGKGKRSDEVNRAIRENGAVYLAAVGGAGALYKHKVRSCECVAFSDLGCEAVYKLTVEDMQLLVATDSRGQTCLK